MNEFNLLELKAQRVRRGLSQKDVANYLGMATSTYAKKESGTIKMGVDEFTELINFLKIEDVSIFFRK